MSSPSHRNTAQTAADGLLIAGFVCAAAVLIGMAYLNRGTYQPEDVLVLIVVSLTAWACPICLITGVIVRIVTLVSARRAADTNASYTASTESYLTRPVIGLIDHTVSDTFTGTRDIKRNASRNDTVSISNSTNNSIGNTGFMTIQQMRDARALDQARARDRPDIVN